jgi:hypothetical protein
VSELQDPRTLMEVLGDYPELMGERADLDPFEDDTPLERLVDGYEVCDSCQ